MKRSFLLRRWVFLGSGLALIAATYGLVRLAFGLFLPDVQRDLGLRPDAAGWVSSGASAMYCVGAVVGFLVAARVPRVLVAAAAGVAGVGALAMAAAPGPWSFGIAAVVASTGAGLASPALVQLVSRAVPGSVQGTAQAVVNSGTGPGLIAAGALALVLLPDWRTAWAWSGVFALVVGVVLLVVSRGSGSGGDRPTAPGTAWFAVHRRVIALALLFGAGSAVVWTYGRSALVDAGAPVAVSVSAWIALGVGGAAVAVTARWTSGLRARTLWAVTAGAVAVAVVALGTAPQSTAVAMLACAVFGWGYTAATGALIAWTTELDAARSSAGTSMLFVALVLGQAVGSAASGALVGTAGYAATFVVGALVTAASAVPAVVGKRSGPGSGTRVTAADAARSSGCTPATPRAPHGAPSRHPAAP
ncbi:putative MFS family arabinose efflux permease [Curtobacterium sp. PhB25]|uniref:MFS transporter n=1 Tax=unclassified Curtobacterium TaxID=257496 RepID=UPI0010D93897|nr:MULTISPECIES: MFS transporter [unclassified Curtobacterium]TCU83836.1 putative MFS family arabinose efflux permease [Curtobacterium sp. PhB191]TDW47640.1 putative MFS family arabinose efflux permease [Curtobacterium sp. PhB42]TDW72187.1 putative MFS family arabinose efflux permease [Curtobacterium sp. PhB25]